MIVGPTGAGKTDLSVRIAGHYGAPILSTDSRQIYRELPIGTAQPSSDQLHAIEHHFIASHNITQEFNCGAFESAALQLLETLFRRGRRVVAVGGSGLYVRALCEGMDDLPQADGALRRELLRQLETEGVEALAERLKRLDPVYYGDAGWDVFFTVKNHFDIKYSGLHRACVSCPFRWIRSRHIRSSFGDCAYRAGQSWTVRYRRNGRNAGHDARGG